MSVGTKTPGRYDLRSVTLRHTAIVFGATVLVNGANFAFHFGAVRILGLPTYSALAALLAVYLIFSVPANVLQAVVTTIVGEAVGMDAAGAAALSRGIIKMALAAALSIAVLGIVMAPLVAGYLAIGDVVAVYLSFLAIALGFAVAALRGLLQGQQRFEAFGISLICEASGNMIFGLGFIALFGGLRFAVLGNVCAIATAFIFSSIAVWKPKTEARITLDVRRLVVKSVGTTVALATIAMMSWFDLVLVRHLT
ncbi:MAG: hypothetical protein M3N19_03180, partial [Candidatus Eremiobacteraeota bacterium]|nr:hypothetical protein [Candidatus Eremiobacteraeota bacterium]